MPAENVPNRCRLVLIAPQLADTDTLAEQIVAAVSGGDVASLILPSFGEEAPAFQARAEKVIERLGERNVAVILAGDTRVAGRVGADGIHLEGPVAELVEAVERFQPKMIVGAGGVKTRHDALGCGEARPDYLFFGRFGYDTTPDPHPRNLALGEWWAELIEIPCIVMGGSSVASVVPVAATGAEFVALSAAVFGQGADPAGSVAEINSLLDAEAPVFGD